MTMMMTMRTRPPHRGRRSGTRTSEVPEVGIGRVGYGRSATTHGSTGRRAVEDGTMVDVTDNSHEATNVEGHPTRSRSTGGQWRRELGDAIVGEGHPHIDRRSLEMAKLIVEKIDADPNLFQVAHENLQRWRRIRGGTLPRCSEEWEKLLERPWTEIRNILLDESDEGQRLRSSHPFAGLVSENERRRIHDAHRA